MLLLQKGLSTSPIRSLTHTVEEIGYQQIGFTDISVATQPALVCAADAAVPVWDSAQAAHVWVAAQDASMSPAVPVRTGIVLLSFPVCSGSHWAANFTSDIRASL